MKSSRGKETCNERSLSSSFAVARRKKTNYNSILCQTIHVLLDAHALEEYTYSNFQLQEKHSS
jgi:hypothetical protein